MKSYLTAVFELRPSRRKAAAMERVRASAEAMFWRVIATHRGSAESVADITAPQERRAAWRTLQAELARDVLRTGSKTALAEPVLQGLIRDAQMAIGSFIELRAGGAAAEWPVPRETTADTYVAGLMALGTAATKEQENEARDAMTTGLHPPAPRPLTIARARDGMLLREKMNSPIVAVLNLLRGSDPRAREAHIRAGIDAATGEVTKAMQSKTRLIIPISCSKWHEQKFLGGRAILRSSLLRRVGERWFLCAQFEFAASHARQTGAVLGIDRGIVNPIAMAAIDRCGAVQAVPAPAGAEVGRIIRQADERRRREQKRRGTTSHHHKNAVKHQLHILANSIVAEAAGRGAQVAVESLVGLKRTITTKRDKDARKGGWRRALKKAQLGKLEKILAYKLALAGLPKPREVFAAGTSIACPACATRDARSRPTQAAFACVNCGFIGHADSVGAVNIARRWLAVKTIAKGAELASIEQDMVARLRLRGDGGLGPLAATGLGSAAGGFVAGRAADDASALASSGQNATQNARKNGGDAVLTEGPGADLQDLHRRKRAATHGLAP